MAKWGEGDPRWIVEERPDAKNVNNWHWTEKNATNWSKDKLRELLTGLVVENNNVCIIIFDINFNLLKVVTKELELYTVRGPLIFCYRQLIIAFCEIKSLTSIEGEASANNRKAKLIFFYEWVIKGEWSGKLKTGDKKYKGKFEIPNLSEENEPDEVDVIVTIDEEKDDGREIKEAMRIDGTPVIQMQLAKYIKQLKDEYSHNVILPTKDQQPKVQNNVENLNKAKLEMDKMGINCTSDKKVTTKDVGIKIEAKTLNMEQEFICGPPQLYQAFTDKEMVFAFTGAQGIFEAEKGGRISLMNGYVTGGFVEMVPSEKLVMRWRLKTWPDAHFSTVTLEFKTQGGSTRLKLKQTEVPSSEYEKTQGFWTVNYFQRIKQTFGFGAHIF